MPRTWSDTDDKQLLVALINTVAPPVSAAQWAEVAKKLGRDDGASAVMQHFNKKLKNYSSKNDEGATTPKAFKSKTAAKSTTPANKKRKRGKADDDEDDDDDGDDHKTMTNATKAEPVPKANAATRKKRSKSGNGKDDDKGTSEAAPEVTWATMFDFGAKNRDALQLQREDGEQAIKEEN